MVPAGRHRATPRVIPAPCPPHPNHTALRPAAHSGTDQGTTGCLFSTAVAAAAFQLRRAPSSTGRGPANQHRDTSHIVPAPCRTCVTILTTADSNQRTNQCVPVPVSSHGRSFSAASCPDPLWPQIHTAAKILRAPRCCSRPAVHTRCRTVVATHPPTVGQNTLHRLTRFSRLITP